MRLLLDTHVFLWYVTNDKRLAPRFASAIRDPGNEAFLSVVSVWEGVIKYSLGKLPLPQSAEIYFTKERKQHKIKSLSLNENSVVKLAGLPGFHHDPFDRMLICQALANRLTLVTVDPQIQRYPVLLL